MVEDYFVPFYELYLHTSVCVVSDILCTFPTLMKTEIYNKEIVKGHAQNLLFHIFINYTGYLNLDVFVYR